MRRLWIQRHKAMAACAVKMKVYIEDSEQGDLDIDGTLCRKLGEIKNGERKMFPVEYDAAKIYVIAGKTGRNAYFEFCHIPAGTEDIFLSGRNYFDPYSGNPFRFDGVQDRDVLHNRERMKGKGRKNLIIGIVAGILVGCLVGGTVGRAVGRTLGAAVAEAGAQPQVFTVENMEITLSSKYSPLDMEGYAACFGSHDTAVFVTRELFSMAPGAENLTLEEYGALVLQNNGMNLTVQLQQTDGLTWFEYDYQNPENGEDMNYYSVLYKGPDAFWMVQFVAAAEEAQTRRPEFFQYAQSVMLGEVL